MCFCFPTWSPAEEPHNTSRPSRYDLFPNYAKSRFFSFLANACVYVPIHPKNCKQIGLTEKTIWLWHKLWQYFTSTIPANSKLLQAHKFAVLALSVIPAFRGYHERMARLHMIVMCRVLRGNPFLRHQKPSPSGTFWGCKFPA